VAKKSERGESWSRLTWTSKSHLFVTSNIDDGNYIQHATYCDSAYFVFRLARYIHSIHHFISCISRYINCKMESQSYGSIQTDQSDLRGENILMLSADEEAPSSNDPVGSSSYQNTNNNSSKAIPPLRGTAPSPTSSLGFSTDRSDHDYVQIIHSMNRSTMDALKEGSKGLTKSENRPLVSILVSITLICFFSASYMASHRSFGSPNGSKTTDQDGPFLYFPNANHDYLSTTISSAATPSSTSTSTNNALESLLETIHFVPFQSVDRSQYSHVSPTDIVFPELFHSSLLLPRNNSNTINSTSTTTTTSSTVQLESIQPLLNVPFPTGAFWTNLVIQPTSDHGFSYPIMSYPYGYKWNPSLMQVSYPALHRMQDSISIRDIFYPDMTFGSVESTVKRNIVRFDPFSVTLRFYGNDTNDESNSDASKKRVKYWESYLVQGSPYVTTFYHDMTPMLRPLSTFQSLSCPRDENGNYKDEASETKSLDGTNNSTTSDFGICSVVESTDDHIELNGVQFLIKTQEGITWMIFSSDPINLIMDKLSRTTITSKEAYSGVLRFALIPPTIQNGESSSNGSRSQPNPTIPLSSSVAVKRLLYHSHTYPVGAKLSWKFNRKNTMVNVFSSATKSDTQSASTSATLTFEYQTKTMSAPAKQQDIASPQSKDIPLLMLALPHHAQVLPTSMIIPDTSFDVVYQTIKGSMTPVVGSTWSYDEELTNIEFDDPLSLSRLKNLDNNTKHTILDQVDKDLTRVLPTLSENVYGFGKQVARLAQLAHISCVLESPTNSSDASLSIASRAEALLYDYLTSFLSGKSDDNVLYDTNFGGIITRNGLIDHQDDFGNGWYNDHHFHYGYILYASAVLGRMNSTFLNEYAYHVDSIMYDVTYSGNIDSDRTDEMDLFFPFTRHKSWFDGHSFASGLFPFADGKSQESSSEAVNCYYGSYLWNLVRWGNGSNGADDDRINFAKMLLAMEIRGAKTYWHMIDPDKVSGDDIIHSKLIYPSDFTKAMMVGNLGMNDVTVSTWFGTKPLYVHMINFMPVTAITSELFSKQYVESEYETHLKSDFDEVEMAWKGYVICDKAINHPVSAWDDATQLTSYELDSALSQSQVYYWISGKEGFDSSLVASNVKNDDNSSGQSSNDLASCASHPNCSHLVGLCCPTSNGIHLDCC
jgi:endoglucanase Acf2